MIGSAHLSSPIQEATTQTLLNLGMNPKSILILDGKSLSKLEYDAYMPINTVIKNFISSIIATLKSIQGTVASAGTCEVKYGDNKHTLPILCFVNQKLMKSKNLTNFAIAHEIGHLLRDHVNEENMIKKMLEKLPTERYIQKNKPEIQYINKLISKSVINQIIEELAALQEIEADATAALINPDIAKKLYVELSRQVSPPSLFKKLLYLSPDPRAQKNSPIHSSNWDKYYLLKTINKLHDKDIEPINETQE